MSFIDRAENEVRVLNVVPCITAIDYPKFLEEETCSPAQSEWSELSARSKTKFPEEETCSLAQSEWSAQRTIKNQVSEEETSQHRVSGATQRTIKNQVSGGGNLLSSTE